MPGIFFPHQGIQRHKVFVSYHHANDQLYRDRFESLFTSLFDIMVSRSVQDGDIDPKLNSERIRQIIRDNYLRDSTVTVVLIGTETWKRKHVDWEIGSSIRDTKLNPRSGLLGILLPTHPNYNATSYTPYIIPPRLYDNAKCKYAAIYDWLEDPRKVASRIHDAFEHRTEIMPDNSYPFFVYNRTGERWYP